MVKVLSKTGQEKFIKVRIWNETVSNLTLMALGSSAPEILLSIIETIGNNFELGDIGPATIVGSAAFNMFFIIGYCVMVIPKNKIKRLKHVNVFILTAIWSIFAYLWMYIIISVISPKVIEIWEALLTLMFFPITVITAYMVDVNICTKMIKRTYIPARRNTNLIVIGAEQKSSHPVEDELKSIDESNSSVPRIESRKSCQVSKNTQSGMECSQGEYSSIYQQYIKIIKKIKVENPNISNEELESEAELVVMKGGPKSRAFYRIQATRKLTAGGEILKKDKMPSHSKILELEKRQTLKNEESILLSKIQQIFFCPTQYSILENAGFVTLNVCRSGGDLDRKVYVEFKTVDGTAKGGDDYIDTEGEIIFEKGEKIKTINISIVDDDIFEIDENFYTKLFNPRIKCNNILQQNNDFIIQKGLDIATIDILDDDHGGVFEFESDEMKIFESKPIVKIIVKRFHGARGKVGVKYKTIEGTSRGQGKDYDDVTDEIIFDDNEITKTIKINIIDNETYEKDDYFFIELYDVKNYNEDIEILNEEAKRIHELGKPTIGKVDKIKIHITEDLNLKKTIDTIVENTNISSALSTSTWKEQFVEAMAIATEEDQPPKFIDYLLYVLSFFWKFLFAFVPPTCIFQGWACFVVSIIVIGILTAFIGDLATAFGCTVGIDNGVVAISFVALGTSLPDMYASKFAAINDPYADMSIGNVTGSNAVNVFLGIGISWLIASVYHSANSESFIVEAGSLAFSVTIFCMMAFIAVVILLIRRHKKIGGELGGPTVIKYITGAFLISLWGIYIILSTLEIYCYIPGF
ncbi:Na(+)/Ca(2+)-exchange protein 2 [Intoshia linei]|uniref:Na(+)/Ca(2+)-exchange protein 2 n=1 Tax=Intoshia linei TaxID=1819745 RepID=A0A177B2G6_9BILA|nr:Na(+)/Ca(2+)-exchange protein 2 [Intoshia linei]